MTSLLNFLLDHPEFIVFFVWPILSAFLNLFVEKLEPRFPRFVRLLRASGFDTKRALEALTPPPNS